MNKHRGPSQIFFEREGPRAFGFQNKRSFEFFPVNYIGEFITTKHPQIRNCLQRTI